MPGSMQSEATHTGGERRRAPRARTDLPLTLSVPGKSAPARICDISLSGVCCTTDRPIGVMTQVGLVIMLPEHSRKASIECRGAVVRSRKLAGERPANAAYETAIFFTSMSDDDRVELQQILDELRAAS